MLRFLNKPTTYYRIIMQQKLSLVCKTFFILTMLFIWENTSTAQMMAYAKQQGPRLEKSTMISLKDALSNLKSHYKIDILFEDKVVSGLLVQSNLLNFDSKIEKNLENILTPFGLRFKKVKDGAFLVMNEKKTKKTALIDTKTQENVISDPSTIQQQTSEKNVTVGILKVSL